ncbi:MAG: hypothetical protein ABIR87_01270 [Sphingomicrobium sp.]
MRLAYLQSPADWRRPNGRQRLLVIVLTLLAELLFLLMLLGLGPSSWGDNKDKAKPTEVTFLPDEVAAIPAEPAPEAASKTVPKPKPVAHVPFIPPSPLNKSPYLKLSSEEFAAADISKLGSAGGHGAAAQGASSASVGVGPGGATLYKAEWFRHPSDAELNGYITKNVEPGSWAEVACKTIADNRVENCQALDESPPGSGLARAIRLAGWQFRIRPPRVDGKPLVGTWVLVHIDFKGRAE